MSIKLCTCGEVIPEDSYWELFPGGGIPDIYIVGSFMPLPEPPITTLLLEFKIEEDLNNYSCFDFPYTPKEGDFLRIHVDGISLDYCFFEGSRGDRSGYWSRSSYISPGSTPSEKMGAISLVNSFMRKHGFLGT